MSIKFSKKLENALKINGLNTAYEYSKNVDTVSQFVLSLDQDIPNYVRLALSDLILFKELSEGVVEEHFTTEVEFETEVETKQNN